jgi:tRNA nucleotidyltransferase (CCA-adding enzyme)
VGGHRIAVASFAYPAYVPGVASATNELLDLQNAEAAVVAVRMEDRTLVFARAVSAVDVGAAIEASLGGGGHPGAAFARTDLDPDEALQRVLAAITASVQRAPTAKALMSRPVKTVNADATVTEAQRLLAGFGHNGLPVMREGELVGIVSRRDLERALKHGLGRSEVSGFMTKRVISATEDTPLAQLESLVQEHNIGRIPIMRDGHLVGIVTRTDLLTARHRPAGDPSPVRRVLDRLPSGVRDLLEAAGEEVGDGSLYLVGGTVRDALLGTGMSDLDVSVVGVPIESFGQRLQQRLGGSLSCHLEFGTCTLALPAGVTLDIATAREEVYEHPGALPDVTPSTFRKDLARRDFTVNAVAVRDEVMRSGVIARPIGPDTLTFCPPLVTTDEQVDTCVSALADALPDA